MTHQVTVFLEKDKDFFVAYCAEFPGANGQGETKEIAINNLEEALELILEDRRSDMENSVSKDAEKLTLTLA